MKSSERSEGRSVKSENVYKTGEDSSDETFTIYNAMYIPTYI